MYGSVPGNHDFWILSAPKVWMPKKDQVQNEILYLTTTLSVLLVEPFGCSDLLTPLGVGTVVATPLVFNLSSKHSPYPTHYH